MSSFVDPRSDPTPGSPMDLPTTTADPEEVADLYRLCKLGKLYEAEKWIRAGRPIQVAAGTKLRGSQRTSALQIALERGDHALALLLLCNGYDPNLEAGCPLDLALRVRRMDLLDLLLEWGADPEEVSLYDLFDTYDSHLFEHFRNLGVDLTRDHEMAAALASHTSNKPLFGFAKRCREHDSRIQVELNAALVRHAGEGNEKGVALCLWAGADPHVPAPSLYFRYEGDEAEEGPDGEVRYVGSTAVERACQEGHLQILERLGPDPGLDDFDELFGRAESSSVVRFLARWAVPSSAVAVLRGQLWRLAWGFRYGTWETLHTVKALFEVGMRWREGSRKEIRDIRHAFLRVSDSDFVDLMRLFAKDDYCAPEVLEELGRTPSIRARMKKVGFIPPAPDDPRRFGHYRPPGAKKVLSSFGVESPKKKKQRPRLPPSVSIGPWSWDGEEIRMDRATLFDLVWSKSMVQLAKEWGLSDVGLAKACRRLQIPLPGRGHWAKTRAGRKMRRPNLPKLREGEAEEIVVRIYRRNESKGEDVRR